MHLTKREQDVLSLIGQGKGCGEIANELGISPLTVRKHRSNMFAKLGHRSAAQLVAHAVETRPVGVPAHAVPASLDALSQREQEVFNLIAEGFTSKEIAKRIRISPSTVRKHRERVMRKLDAHHLADIIGVARALRLCGAANKSYDDEACCTSKG